MNSVSCWSNKCRIIPFQFLWSPVLLTILSLVFQVNKGITGHSGSKLKKVDIHINVDGLTVIDTKTKMVLHKFPLHKISFCADDKQVIWISHVTIFYIDWSGLYLTIVTEKSCLCLYNITYNTAVVKVTIFCGKSNIFVYILHKILG